MSPKVKRGLQVAKDLLRKHLQERSIHFSASSGVAVLRSDIDDTIQWIAHQEKLDENRRRPRK